MSCQMNNGEADLAGKFHKTLPHDEFGRVRRGQLSVLAGGDAGGGREGERGKEGKGERQA